MTNVKFVLKKRTQKYPLEPRCRLLLNLLLQAPRSNQVTSDPVLRKLKSHAHIFETAVDNNSITEAESYRINWFEPGWPHEIDCYSSMFIWLVWKIVSARSISTKKQEDDITVDTYSALHLEVDLEHNLH